jgi:ABC-2 type transport system ATP-binding protein
MTDVIVAQGLTRSYDGQPPAVDSLSFSIARGEIFALLGPNGAGKTTTIRLLSALIYPTGGEVRVNGVPTTEADRIQELHDAIGVLPEVPGLYESLSAYRNLLFYGRLHGLSDATIYERAHALLTTFDLWERREQKIATYSKGMKQKVAIVRALLHDPPCLILDEPISGLDPEAAKAVRDFLVEQRHRGRTVVLSTHNLDDADRLSDRVAVIRSRLVALDSPHALKVRLFHQRVSVQLKDAGPDVMRAVRDLPSVVHAEWAPPHLLLQLQDPDRDLPSVVESLVRAGLRVQYIAPLEHSLEDAYLKLLEESRGGPEGALS